MNGAVAALEDKLRAMESLLLATRAEQKTTRRKLQTTKRELQASRKERQTGQESVSKYAELHRYQGIVHVNCADLINIMLSKENL